MSSAPLGVVFAYFLRVVGNRQDAEELTQGTSVRACGAALHSRGDSSVKTWVLGIARRVVLGAARAAARLRKRLSASDMAT